MSPNPQDSSSSIEPLRLPAQSFQKLFAGNQPQKRTAAQCTLCWDTRAVPNDRPFVLFAKAGKNFDPWHDLERLLVRAQQQNIEGWCIVDNTFESLNKIAALDSHARERVFPVPEFSRLLCEAASMCLVPETRDLKTFAITGTNGKTSTTSLLAQLITETNGTPTARLGTLGFFDGSVEFDQPFPTTPDFPTFCCYLNHLVRVGTKALVMEASSHGLAEGRLHDWQFDGAALTNLTPDHLDFHKTMEAYWDAKKLLFSRHLKQGAPAVIAAQKSPWRDAVSMLCSHGHPTTLILNTMANTVEGMPALDPENKAQVHSALKIVEYDYELALREGLSLHLKQRSGKPTTHSRFRAPMLFGDFQAENLVVALCMMNALGHHWDSMEQRTESLKPVLGRMEVVTPISERTSLPLVFVDYAHTPDALESSISSLRKIAMVNRTKIITVFGCGGDRDRTKRPAMAEIAGRLSDLAIVTSDNPRTEDPLQINSEIAAGFSPAAKWVIEQDRALAIKLAITQANPGDLVIVAGKGHEDYQIIGSSKLPFSDAEIARKVLQSWRLN
jgi:UDP-N-acetylmuramoyl-L-alanyl-D-glutamate--2,6-diaminopimelate ligase